VSRDPKVLVLAEYGEGELEMNAEQERTLRLLARGRVTILPGACTSRWLVKASSYVGSLVAPGAKILIVPKVPTANLFHLLEAGGRALEVGPETFEYERTQDLVPAFATFFARHLEVGLGQGVPRDYRECEERGVGVRGRINLPAQRSLAGLPLPVEYRFDDYTADIAINRILRGATTRLLRLPGVTVDTMRRLRQLDRRFEGVGAVTPMDLRSETVFTRLNAHCRSAERLARVVLSSSSLIDAVGVTGAAEFLVDMNKVFEEFVETRLRRSLRGRLRVLGQQGEWLDIASQIRILPDLVFESLDRVVYVADSKYKVTSDGLGRQADYYQLLAYTSALGLPEGLLVYCWSEGTSLPRNVEVRNLATQLRTWPLRLDRTPRHLENEIEGLAEFILSRVAALRRLSALNVA